MRMRPSERKIINLISQNKDKIPWCDFCRGQFRQRLIINKDGHFQCKVCGYVQIDENKKKNEKLHEFKMDW
jgi:hypothetical protein